MVLGLPSCALLALALGARLALGDLSDTSQSDVTPPGQQGQETREAQETQEGQQPQQKKWEKYVPAEYRQFADKQQKEQQQQQQQQQQKDESTETAEAPSAVLFAHPLALTEDDGTRDSNIDSRLTPRQANLRAVSEAESKESEASGRARDAIQHLRSVTVQQVMAESHQEWTNVKELADYLKEDGADSWEDTLEKRTQLLEDFVKKPRKNVLDFNASQAVQLVYQVNAASAEVAENSRKQQERVKAAIQKAKQEAVQKVKSMQLEARSSAREWKAMGKQTVRAQKLAGLGEGVYERHQDEMSDAAGDVGNKAEYYAERLQDKVRDAYSNMADQVRDLPDDQHGKELQRRASQAVDELHSMAKRLGASAAYEEAESSARFRAEEQRWNSLQGPKSLAAVVPTEADERASAVMNPVVAASFVLVSLLVLVVLRHRPMTQPLDIEAPPLLG